MKMKILFLVLAILSILVGYFISFTCYMDYGLGLAGTGFGEVVLIAGIFLLVVCIADMIMSIVALRRGKVKKAIAFALVGVLYSAVILGGYLIDDAAWEIIPATAENTFDFNYREGLLEPADRLTLELTPFSQYK